MKEAELVEAMLRYIHDPVSFVREILQAEPDEWQKDTLMAIASNPRVAVRSGHGVGKTTLEAWILLWFMFTRPFPKVPCTAPTKQQLHDVLWAEVSKWMEKSPILKKYYEWQKTKIIQKQHSERWFAVAKTSNKPENVAGFHEEHILFIVDEGSGVADNIYETIEGALTTDDAKIIVCGNPTKNTGVFHDAFFKDRALYWTRKVSCLESNRVVPEYAERIAKKYGKASNVYRVRVLGEFPKTEPDVFIPIDFVEAAIMRETVAEGHLELGVDVARFGDDESVIVSRMGLKMLSLDTYQKQDTMATTGWVLNIAKEQMRKYAKPACTIKIDDDGVGGGVTDRLREVIREEGLNITVIDCHNGGVADDKSHYENWGTESWANFRDMLQNEQVELIDDDDLVGQLTTRKYGISSKAKIAIERKKDMKKRGLSSPDRADATVLAFATSGREVDPTLLAILTQIKVH